MDTPTYLQALTVAATVMLLAGCSNAPEHAGIPTIEHNDAMPGSRTPAADQIPVLSEGWSEQDALPAAVREDHALPWIQDSVRLLADYDGVRYYVGRGTKLDDICLMAFKSEDVWHGMCTSSLPFESEAQGLGRTQLIPAGGTPLRHDDEATTSPDWVQVTDNLVVLK